MWRPQCSRWCYHSNGLQCAKGILNRPAIVWSIKYWKHKFSLFKQCFPTVEFNVHHTFTRERTFRENYWNYIFLFPRNTTTTTNNNNKFCMLYNYLLQHAFTFIKCKWKYTLYLLYTVRLNSQWEKKDLLTFWADKQNFQSRKIIYSTFKM